MPGNEWHQTSTPPYTYTVCTGKTVFFSLRKAHAWFEVMTVLSRPSLFGYDVQHRSTDVSEEHVTTAKAVGSFEKPVYGDQNTHKSPIYIAPWSRTATTPPFPQCKLDMYLKLFKYTINIIYLHVLWVCLIRAFTADSQLCTSCQPHTLRARCLLWLV
jgi:hypothetical protein